MNTEAIKRLCIESSETYYQYLKNSGKGRSEIEVYSIDVINKDEGIFKLRLSKKILELDAIFFLIVSQQKEYESTDIKIVEYDYDKNILLIQPRQDLRAEFSKLSHADLKIISDLKFLVKRVQVWYETNGDKLQIPKAPSILESTKDNIKYSDTPVPSKDQKNAIHNIFTNPFNYIWGAPGTGKTQVVLSNSLIHYVLSGKKVAIFAPTNNAIEQVLYGVLKMTGKAGIENKKILRLGNPSKAYAEKYPETCEANGILRKISELENQIKIASSALKSRSRLEKINAAEKELVAFQTLADFEQKRHSILESLAAAKRKLQLAENNFDEKQIEIKTSKRQIESIERSVSSLLHGLKKIFKKGPSQQETDLIAARKAHETLIRESKVLYSSVEDCSNQKNILQREYDDVSIADQVILKLRKALAFDKKANELANDLSLANYQKKKKQISDHIRELTVELNNLSLQYIEYASSSLNDLEKVITELTKKKKHLESQTLQERLKTANIVAATLDCYIGRFCEEELKVDHIFLDEAGYACIIKALSLFTNNIPVTFLGDHKQLPPVCELGDRDFTRNEKYLDVFIWSQSAIFTEKVFSCTKEEMIKAYFEGKEFHSELTVKSELKETHRFGKNLAAVLDKYVYSNGFTSKQTEGETKMYFINAPGTHPQPIDPQTQKPARRNSREANAIRDLVKSGKVTDFAILTPYSFQVRAIGDLLPDERNDHKIMTVHGSQGKEWDDIILSVVDTDRMWFTDSLSKASKGVNLINTAVSRAKKRVIIVCNHKYWREQTNQLIKGLLDNAIPFS